VRVVSGETLIDISSFCPGGIKIISRVGGLRWIVAFAMRRLEMPVPIGAAYVLGEATQDRIRAAGTSI